MREILQMDRIMEKLTILSAAARYDVACTSSGVQRGGDGTHMGNAYASGICHAFTGDGRCISLLKILYTNDCIYDCKYCRNRCSNDVKRVSFTPEEICKLTMEFYRRNYIEGLFLSSGILHSPDYTMGLLYETLYLLRTKYHFNGYIHVKGIPGASADLLELTGYLADRMSVNLELPTSDALRQIAPNKVRKNILSPMRQLQNGIRQSREFHAVLTGLEDIVSEGLQGGEIVRLGELGSLQLSLSGEGAATEDTYTDSMIEKVRVLFRPGTVMQEAINNLAFERVPVKYKKEEEDDGAGV